MCTITAGPRGHLWAEHPRRVCSSVWRSSGLKVGSASFLIDQVTHRKAHRSAASVDLTSLHDLRAFRRNQFVDKLALEQGLLLHPDISANLTFVQNLIGSFAL